jgi:hypothetical protein
VLVAGGVAGGFLGEVLLRLTSTFSTYPPKKQHVFRVACVSKALFFKV